MSDASRRNATRPETVYFSVKGQVVIPKRLRREFEIEEGTNHSCGYRDTHVPTEAVAEPVQE